mgnify:FL=1
MLANVYFLIYLSVTGRASCVRGPVPPRSCSSLVQSTWHATGTKKKKLQLTISQLICRISKCGGIHGTSCGWCKSINKALTGDASGPFDGECNSENWIHKASQCPCEEMTHCDNIRGNANIYDIEF